ncbi:ribose-5-phosphate isomerase B [Eubacterium nodatum ATCC 33099]|nr:ribose-5-phosphate isomerase B [Eubacterium nodatum ATCC 33099]
MIVAIAGDHGGFALKQRIREHLIERGIKIADLGTDSEESVDYPEFGKACAQAVASGKADRGIVICGTGIGISIAANRIRGIRCGLCTSVEMAELSRKHNNANMLAMGGRITSVEDAIRITDAWLDTEFEGGRHSRRVDMLDSI